MKKAAVFLCLAMILWVCCRVSVVPGYIDEDKKAVETEIEDFHDRFNTGLYEQIISNSHPAFAASLSKRELIQAMRNTKDHFGDFQSVTNMWINIVVGAPVQGRAVYNSKFDKTDATEVFAFVKEGKAFKLAQYQIYEGTVKPQSDNDN